MPIELAARTDAGGRLVATAERLSETLAADAPLHDRDGSFPFEAIDALKAAHYFAAPVPVEMGGLGVCSRTTWSSHRVAWRGVTRPSRSA